MFPRNFVKPHLRVGQTESALDSQINDDAIESDPNAYLQDVSQLSELETSGMFHTSTANRIMTYHFTAQSNWREKVYYYRTLTMDRDLLSDDEPSENQPSNENSDEQTVAPALALQTGDWERIDVPITSGKHFSLPPTVLGDRLFILWMEVSKSTKDDTDIYHCKLKVSRRNIDGSFSEPRTVPIKVPNANQLDESQRRNRKSRKRDLFSLTVMMKMR